MCIMFHLMMGWIFCVQKKGLAKKLIGLLMLLMAVQYSKDLVFINHFYGTSPLAEHLASSIDIVTVPLYALILFEFCRPGWLTALRAAFFEIPFVLLSVLFMVTHADVFFSAMMVFSVIYGVGCAIWTLYELPRYHRYLKEEYSYDEDINLHWMRGVMVLFFVILSIWVVSNLFTSMATDIGYMISSLIGWSVVCYFINKQELVLREVVSSRDMPCAEPEAGAIATSAQPVDVNVTNAASAPVAAPADAPDSLCQRLVDCFEKDRVYLDPKLRLSELAARLGTNRTYLSQYFNKNCDQSFYSYVNNYRVGHSMQLLRDTDYTLEVIASMSGFNSLSTFRRAFAQTNGCSPLQYRAECRGGCEGANMC